LGSMTKTGLAVGALVAVACAVFGVQTVIDTVTGVFEGGGTEIIGEGDTQVMAASNAKSKIGKCTPQQMVNDKRCGDLNVLVVDAARIPFIARNTKLAWESGLPSVLTMNRGKQATNRAAACPRSFPKPHGGSCDEYPMAVTDEGGKQARTEEVPVRENSCQGGLYGAQYPKDGEQFIVIIDNIKDIATSAFTGTDIAKVKGAC
jgi:hypothetical protein